MNNLNVNYERFPPEYFSGSNIHIFFEDIYIDEITLLQFNLTEQIRPVYGYNSYVYDDMLRGNRIVNGAFRINFKKNNYIREAVSTILNNDYSLEDNFPEINMDNIDQKRNELYQYSKDGWSGQFEELSEQFKQKIWQNANVNRNNPSITDGSRPYFDYSDDFNIIVKYGPYDSPNTKYKIENEYRDHISNGTIIKLEKISLNSVSQVIDDTGRPISEEYSFLAKDMSRK